MTPDCREVSHSNRPRGTFIDERQAREPPLVSRKFFPHVDKETAVYFVNNLEVARKEGSEEIDAPFLQRLGQESVIGVGKGGAGYIPSCVPFELILIHQQSHQLRDGNRRVRVV